MILGWVLVRPIPLPTSTSRTPSSPWRSYLENGDGSNARLLPDNEHEGSYVRSPKRRARAVSIASCGEVVASGLPGDELPDVSGKKLLMNYDFWLLFTIMSLCESPDTRQ